MFTVDTWCFVMAYFLNVVQAYSFSHNTLGIFDIQTSVLT